MLLGAPQWRSKRVGQALQSYLMFIRWASASTRYDVEISIQRAVFSPALALRSCISEARPNVTEPNINSLHLRCHFVLPYDTRRSIGHIDQRTGRALTLTTGTHKWTPSLIVSMAGLQRLGGCLRLLVATPGQDIDGPLNPKHALPPRARPVRGKRYREVSPHRLSRRTKAADGGGTRPGPGGHSEALPISDLPMAVGGFATRALVSRQHAGIIHGNATVRPDGLLRCTALLVKRLLRLTERPRAAALACVRV